MVTTLNAGPYHEFKGVCRDIPFECATSSLKSENGESKIPTGPGNGVVIDPSRFSQETRK